jgi:hypothetical protein
VIDSNELSEPQEYTIYITLFENHYEHLYRMARSFGIPVMELVRANVEEMLQSTVELELIQFNTQPETEEQYTVRFTLSKKYFDRLCEISDQYEIEDLAQLTIYEMLTHPTEDDAALDDYLLAKNAELYRRLAKA